MATRSIAADNRIGHHTHQHYPGVRLPADLIFLRGPSLTLTFRPYFFLGSSPPPLHHACILSCVERLCHVSDIRELMRVVHGSVS
jgi:hypothetical protein